MLGTLAAPSLLGSCTGSEGDKAAGISFAMNYFKVSEGGFEEGIGGSLGERRGLCRFVFRAFIQEQRGVAGWCRKPCLIQHRFWDGRTSLGW